MDRATFFKALSGVLGGSFALRGKEPLVPAEALDSRTSQPLSSLTFLAPRYSSHSYYSLGTDSSHVCGVVETVSADGRNVRVRLLP